MLAKSINQVIYFLTNCFTFLTKFWMLQVRKSRFCGISAIFFQCCFKSKTQLLLMTVSDFSGFCSRNNILEGGFTVQCGDLFFSWEGVSFLSEGMLYVDGVGFQKKVIRWRGKASMGNPPTTRNPACVDP